MSDNKYASSLTSLAVNSQSLLLPQFLSLESRNRHCAPSSLPPCYSTTVSWSTQLPTPQSHRYPPSTVKMGAVVSCIKGVFQAIGTSCLLSQIAWFSPLHAASFHAFQMPHGDL